MVELDRIDDHEVLQVVLVGRVVAVPGHHVEGTVPLHRLEQTALELVDHAVLDVDVDVLEPGRRRQKVARVRQTVGTYFLILNQTIFTNRILDKKIQGTFSK